MRFFINRGGARLAFRALHTLDRISGHAVDHNKRVSSVSKWYAKQMRQDVLCIDDVNIEGKRSPCIIIGDTELRSEEPVEESLVGMFVGCAAAAAASPCDLALLFEELPARAKVDVIIWYLRSDFSQPPSGLSASQMMVKAMEDASLGARDIIRVVSQWDENCTFDLDVFERLLITALTISHHEVNKWTEAASFTKHIVFIAEPTLSKSRSWRQALLAEGLLLEACAYTSAWCEPLRSRTGKGFGDDVYSLLDDKNSDHLAAGFSKACQGMPPLLRQYTLKLVTAHVIRTRQEDSRIMGNHLQDAMVLWPSEVEYASSVHFVLKLGDSFTANILLSGCSTRGQIAAVMTHAMDAGNSLAIRATRQMKSIRPSDDAVVALQATSGNQKITLVFSAQVYAMEADHTACVSAALKDHYFRAANSAPDHMVSFMQAIQRYLHIPLNAAASSTTTLKAVLLRASQGTIPMIVKSLTHPAPILATWWASLYVEVGDTNRACIVLECFASREVTPDMRVLVDLLECIGADDSLQLSRCVCFLQDVFPFSLPSVLRAFVERLAARLGAAGGVGDEESARQLLSRMTLFGLLHFPIKVIEGVASEASSPPGIQHAADIIADARNAFKGSAADNVAPLHVDAIERIVEAMTVLGMAPTVSCFSLSHASKSTVWWSASGQSQTSSIMSFIHHSQALPLWPVVLRIIRMGPHSLSLNDVHKALRFLSLTECPAADLVAVTRSKSILLMPANGRGAARRCAERQMMRTLVCIVEALTARGEWQAALQLFPNASVVLPERLEIAKLKVLLHDEKLSTFASLQLRAMEGKCTEESCSPSTPRRGQRFHKRRRATSAADAQGL